MRKEHFSWKLKVVSNKNNSLQEAQRLFFPGEKTGQVSAVVPHIPSLFHGGREWSPGEKSGGSAQSFQLGGMRPWGTPGCLWYSQVLWVFVRWFHIPVQGHEILTSLFVLWFLAMLSILSYRIGQGIPCWWLVLSAGDLFWFTAAAVVAHNLLVPDTSGHVCIFWCSTGCLHSLAICFLQHTKPILFCGTGGWLCLSSIATVMSWLTFTGLC